MEIINHKMLFFCLGKFSTIMAPVDGVEQHFYVKNNKNIQTGITLLKEFSKNNFIWFADKPSIIL